MKKTTIKESIKEQELSDIEDKENLDRFIEKRKIQNEALKKIADMNMASTKKAGNKTK